MSRAQVQGTLAPGYYFCVTDGENTPYRVEIRKIFATPEAARAEAVIIAKKLARDGDWERFEVSVTDVFGNDIARVPIHPRSKRKRGKSGSG